MLNRIHVENYKCLRNVTVDLGDFTILVGPNDSGKSSFLEVIEGFGKIAQAGYQGLFAGDRSALNLVWRKDPSLTIVLEAAGNADRRSFTYRVELPATPGLHRESLECDGAKLFWTNSVDSPPGQPPQLFVIAAVGQAKQQHAVQPTALFLPSFGGQTGSPGAAIKQALMSRLQYQFDQDQLPRPSVPERGMELVASGANLAAVLDLMQNSPDRSAFASLQKALHDAIPTLDGILLPPAPQSAGAKALQFILAGDVTPPVTIPASLSSGGALLLTAFLTLAYTTTPGLLLFEEPENGLHPYRLQLVVDILRKMSRGQVGNRKRQIVITTHSPLLLNYATADEVRVFVRDPERGTRVFPMAEVPDVDRLLKEFSLGELWYLLGEEKLAENKMPKEQPA